MRLVQCLIGFGRAVSVSCRIKVYRLIAAGPIRKRWIAPRIVLVLTIVWTVCLLQKDSQAQSLAILAPAAGATISATEAITIETSALSSYALYLDATRLVWDRARNHGPQVINVDTTKFSTGWHSLSLIGFNGKR